MVLRKFGLALLLACLCGGVGGCATMMSDASGDKDECLVCKHNADLACVDVAVDASTPRFVYLGKTYYFCSDTCRDEFAKEPGKYAGGK